MTDPVLDPGVGPVAGPQERQLAGGCVRDERLVAPTRQPPRTGIVARPEWRRSRRTITRIPPGQSVRSSSPVSSATSSPSRTPLSASLAGLHAWSGSRLMASRTGTLTANPRCTRPDVRGPDLVAQPVQQLMRSTRAVAMDQQMLAVSRRDLGDRFGEDLDGSAPATPLDGTPSPSRAHT